MEHTAMTRFIQVRHETKCLLLGDQTNDTVISTSCLKQKQKTKPKNRSSYMQFYISTHYNLVISRTEIDPQKS